MKKNIRKIYKKKYKKNGFIERFSFVMIYIIHKMLVLLNNCLNFLKVVFSNAFLKTLIDFHFFF